MSADDIGKNLMALAKSGERRVMEVLRMEVKHSVDLNFIHQGRPNKWAKKKRPDGRAILTGPTGNLQRSINYVISGNEIRYGSKLIYAPVHNYGQTIKHPGRKLTFRKNRAGKTVFASSKHKKITKSTVSRPYEIQYPVRNFTDIPLSDYPRIMRNAARAFIQ